MPNNDKNSTKRRTSRTERIVWKLSTNEAGQFQLLCPTYYKTNQIEPQQEWPVIELPLIARSRMGDMRIASVKCPKALYFALQDAFAAGMAPFIQGDIITLNGIGLLEVSRGITRVMQIDLAGWRMLFGDHWDSDGSLPNVPETQLALDPAVVDDMNREQN